ncbi:Thioredoxin domain-containing protein [Paracidovorax avenae ATCC 19860]|uniref:Thioredoxin domain-containing protein n=1 Tax=Paracidovorax avenae (strain ATCC 19860 / DSM 7227 / CCUG 15838 / JCM 20985 / LMG 2117 / NCPPB 1011) TaxID=643561 RepID=F0Q793_PARA1|nr:thioredoxin domain-containing protein [Paracidovorax avenae]ADX45768.1 Thioredoxin domain-containing protein [Paracidovorax avenae ATCC 19860]AVS67990.1 thiol reductase thioredoxin [Paracidovorax avenae]
MPDTTSPPAPLSAGDLPVVPGWWVVCLCAAWCGVCREYGAVFEALRAAHPDVRFEWVDVEDEEDLAGDLDVETFPTVLVADGIHARFLGPVLPQSGVLARMLAALRQEGGAPPVDAQAQAVFERIRQARAAAGN